MADRLVVSNKCWELTEIEKHRIKTNSIERIINTTISLLNKSGGPSFSRQEYADDKQEILENWDNLKALVVKLWGKAREDLMREDLAKEGYTIEVKD